MDYTKVDVVEYINEKIASGEYSPFSAEKVATVEVDQELGQTGWIVTKVDEGGNVLVDSNGHSNEWIIPPKKFAMKYELDPNNDGLYKPTGGVQEFVQINENVIIHQ